MTQQYSLRWNNHQPNFISTFSTLLKTRTLVDVTIAAEGKQMDAHKIVLAACSTFFQALFVSNPSSHPIVILKDVAFADLETMIDFMYGGVVNVTEEQLPQVLETAKMLKIKGLTEMPDTSVTRSQGAGATADFAANADLEPQRPTSPSASPAITPAVSPSISNSRKRRRRRSSAGSMPLNLLHDVRLEESDSAQNLDNNVILCSDEPLPRPRREYEELRGNTQQVTAVVHVDAEPQMDPGAGAAGSIPGQWTMNMLENYPRYNSCVGVGGGQQDGGLPFNNAMSPHMGGDMTAYAPCLGVAGPAPGPSCMPDQQQQQGAMPAPAKRRRTSNPQAEEKFQRALDAVRFGGIGFCKAARIFGVNNRTLWLEYKKRGFPNNRSSIRNRIKREHSTPPLPVEKEEQAQPEQQMALLCPPHPVPVSFIDSRSTIDFPLQGVPHNSPLNILGMNFNSMQ